MRQLWLIVLPSHTQRHLEQHHFIHIAWTAGHTFIFNLIELQIQQTDIFIWLKPDVCHIVAWLTWQISAFKLFVKHPETDWMWKCSTCETEYTDICALCIHVGKASKLPLHPSKYSDFVVIDIKLSAAYLFIIFSDLLGGHLSCASLSITLNFCCCLYYSDQRCSYVANLYPNFARIMSIVILPQIILNRSQNCRFWWKINKFQIHQSFCPYCRE